MKVAVKLFILMISFSIFAQYDYSVSKENPFGQYNPDAPKQILDYKELIGICDCISEVRKQDQTWAAPVKMIWKWSYILNGTAIQDETLKEDGTHSGSIRQFDKDSLIWKVHYYTSRKTPQSLPVWKGNRTENRIILYKEQKAPNGMEGAYRLTFSDISENGFKWIGEWVDKTEKIVYPTWRISCTKRK